MLAGDMAMPPAHRRMRECARSLTTLSRGGLCGEGKAVQRIPRSVSRNGQTPWVHHRATESPWLLPEAHDRLGD